jgi:hypothetical protein
MKRSGSRSPRTVFNLLLHLGHRSQSEGGYIIVVVAGLIVAISALLLTGELFARTDSNSTKSSGNSAAGFYAAEAGLNLRAKDIRAKFEGYGVPTGTSPITNDSSNLPCSTGNVGTLDFACNSSLTVQDYLYPNDTTKRIPVSTYVIDQNNIVGGVTTPTAVTIGPNEPFAGLNAQEFRYDVVSTAYDRANNPTAFLGIRFKSRLVPLFQFAAFYENDLDFTRPAAMSIHGPIHTNGAMYLNASEPVTLYGQLTSAGKMYRGEKDPDRSCNGDTTGNTVSVLNPVSNTLLGMACNGSPRGEITTETTNKNRIRVGGTYANDWGGQLRPEIPRLTIPSSSFIDAKLPDTTNKYDYWNKADLRIALRLTNDSDESPVSIEVENADATLTHPSVNTAATATLNSSSCLPTNTTLTGSGYLANSNSVTVANGSSFNNGDPLRIVGSTFADFDENVIANKATANTLPIRRPLGQQAIASSSGVTVSKAILWSSKTFYNYREKTLDTTTGRSAGDKGRLIRMLNVDVQGLMNCAGSLMGKSLDDATEGGLVWYFTVIGPKSNVDTTKATPDSPNSYGIRLYNGATLGSSVSGAPAIKGLTVASDQAMYIRGDYNSNSKKPAAILADSINILSNASPLDDSSNCTSYNAIYNASDCSGPTSYDTRNASSTKINAAFLAGVDTTGTASGENSGGLNNYTRLHEDWSGGPIFTYRGSMVSLGKARRVNGKFGSSGDRDNWNVYYPPTRNWDYDTDFDNAANLPPLTPRFVYLRQERFSRDFNRTASLSLPYSVASLFPHNFASIMPTVQFTSFRF